MFYKYREKKVHRNRKDEGKLCINFNKKTRVIVTEKVTNGFVINFKIIRGQWRRDKYKDTPITSTNSKRKTGDRIVKNFGTEKLNYAGINTSIAQRDVKYGWKETWEIWGDKKNIGKDDLTAIK